VKKEGYSKQACQTAHFIQIIILNEVSP
jgi:hypothetical protein